MIERHFNNLPRQYENAVVGCEADEDAVGGAFHLRPAQDEDGEEVADEAKEADPVEEHRGDEELKDEVDLRLRGLQRLVQVQKLGGIVHVHCVQFSKISSSVFFIYLFKHFA